jgi:hypothetical protein
MARQCPASAFVYQLHPLDLCNPHHWSRARRVGHPEIAIAIVPRRSAPPAPAPTAELRTVWISRKGLVGFASAPSVYSGIGQEHEGDSRKDKGHYATQSEGFGRRILNLAPVLQTSTISSLTLSVFSVLTQQLGWLVEPVVTCSTRQPSNSLRALDLLLFANISYYHVLPGRLLLEDTAAINLQLGQNT